MRGAEVYSPTIMMRRYRGERYNQISFTEIMAYYCQCGATDTDGASCYQKWISDCITYVGTKNLTHRFLKQSVQKQKSLKWRLLD